jgi:hypothetical protein
MEDIKILVLINGMPLRYFQFEHYNAKRELPFCIKDAFYEQALWDDAMSPQILYRKEINYIITGDLDVQEDQLLAEDHGIIRLRGYIRSHPDEFNDAYELVRTVTAPNALGINIYRYSPAAEERIITEA